MGRSVGELERQFLRLTCAHTDETLLDLLDDGIATELDDIVTPRLLDGDEIEDDRVVGSHGPSLDGNELGDRRTQSVELGLDELLGHLDLRDSDLELFPVRQLGLCLHRDRRGELPVLVVGSG